MKMRLNKRTLSFHDSEEKKKEGRKSKLSVSKKSVDNDHHLPDLPEGTLSPQE